MTQHNDARHTWSAPSVDTNGAAVGLKTDPRHAREGEIWGNKLGDLESFYGIIRVKKYV